MRSVLASVRFALVAALQNFARNLAVSLAAVFTMGLIMLLVGGTLLLTHTVDAILTQQENNADEIYVYVQNGVSLRTITDYEQRFRLDPSVDQVSFTSTDQAISVAEQDGESYIGSALQVLGSNPLPASIDLHVHSLQDLTQLANTAKTLPIADTTGGRPTNYNPQVIPKLQTVINWTFGIGLALSLVLAVISLVIIMNTIRTAVYVRRTEIEIMKLVGAGDWFVRWPFVLEGMFGGILAAAFGAVVVGLAYSVVLTDAHQYLLVPVDIGYLEAIVVVLLLVGAALGSVGSLLGVRRFLHV